jgi:uracil-DNA glycosylase
MDIIINHCWNEILKEEFEKAYFKSLRSFIQKEYRENKDAVFPDASQIFRAFNDCPFENVKVVILGQDPYPTRGHAHGLSFSVDKNVKPFPKSLINIFKELELDTGKPYPQNGSLEHWAEQGVLLLNSILTVKEGLPASHVNKGWEIFTDAVIEILSIKKKEIVYILWGTKAIEKAKSVNAKVNLILTSVHPSPLSAYRGFFGSKPFSKTNHYLLSKGKKAIKW